MRVRQQRYISQEYSAPCYKWIKGYAFGLPLYALPPDLYESLTSVNLHLLQFVRQNDKVVR